MPTISDKVHHVRSRMVKDAGKHHCHWPGCGKAVHPAMWGCKAHWYTLPARLRSMVWAAYIPGQEITKRPTKQYLAVAREVQAWIAQYEEDRR